MKSEKKVKLSRADGGKFKMYIKLPGLIEDIINKQGTWEPHLAYTISQLVKKDSIFLDIGANIGYHSLFIASALPRVTCISFEPNPNIFEQLKRNVRTNKLRNLTIHNLAIGDQSGTIEFFMTREKSYNRGLSGVKYYSDLGKDFKKTTVQMVPLDSFLEYDTKKKVKVIKIDTQGYEYQVLSGAADIIEKSQPIVCFEYHEHSDYGLSDILRLLPDYQVYRINAWSGQVRKLDLEDPEQSGNDIICIPNEKSIRKKWKNMYLKNKTPELSFLRKKKKK